MKCHVVKDLLPSYVDDLLSSQTRQDVEVHLAQCPDCQRLLAQLQAPLATPYDPGEMPAERRQLDFLKKLRRTALRNMIGALTIVLVVCGALTLFLATGSSVDSTDLTIESVVEDEMWEIHLTLSGYRELLVRTSPIYSEQDEQGQHYIIGTIVEPFSVLPSPLMDGDNKTFIYGSDLRSFDNPDFHIILRLDDKDIVYRAGQLEGAYTD